MKRKAHDCDLTGMTVLFYQNDVMALMECNTVMFERMYILTQSTMYGIK
jgi:hypothetical protein